VNVESVDVQADRSREEMREARLAWIATLLSCGYYLWVGVVAYLRLPILLEMQAGLGMEGRVSTPYKFLATHPWVLVLAAVVLVGALIAKEVRMRDKRWSIMVTCLVAVVCLIFIDLTKSLMVRPFFILMSGLS